MSPSPSMAIAKGCTTPLVIATPVGGDRDSSRLAAGVLGDAAVSGAVACAAIGDPQIAKGVKGNRRRKVEVLRNRGLFLQCIARAINQNIVGVDIGDIEVALRVDGEPSWVIQWTSGGKAGRCESGKAQ